MTDGPIEAREPASDASGGRVRRRALAVLEAAWDDDRGYCFPNPDVYPHLWLWDSCFHSIAWASLGDPRGIRELDSVFVAQLDDGFLPHMRYAQSTVSRGPLEHASSFTQPPVYAHAAAYLSARGFDIGQATLARIARALDWLWEHRLSDEGLLFIVHPWESGTDDSPRWDDWIGLSEWNRPAWTEADFELADAVKFGPTGAAVASSRFEVAPAGFNAIAAHAAEELASLGFSDPWADRARRLADAMDDHLWVRSEGMWSDLPRVGGGPSSHVPTLDGFLGALVTADQDKAEKAIAHLRDPARFRARYGFRYVAGDHATYAPDQYWRGSSWMQMNYLAYLAAKRWGDSDLVAHLRDATRRAARASGFAEHWNPETGQGYGAVPQTWSAVVAAID